MRSNIVVSTFSLLAVLQSSSGVYKGQPLQQEAAWNAPSTACGLITFRGEDLPAWHCVRLGGSCCFTCDSAAVQSSAFCTYQGVP